jgi:hypothetical protein
MSAAAFLFACGSSTSSGTATGPGGTTTSPDGGTTTATSDLCANAPADLATSQQHARTCSLGDDAKFFVRSAPYAKVVIEILATKSATPSQAATDHLVAVMGDLLDKSGGVTVMHDPPIDDVTTPMSLTQASAIEDASRTQFALGDTIVFYYLVVSTNSSDDTANSQILGYSYRPSSMVVFQKSIDDNAGAIGQPSRDVVESTVVAHEFGHILGLVNAGTPMQTPHEDPAHPKHDTNSACLMYWSNNSSAGLANLFTGGNIPDYDANCRADLAALKQ